MTTYRDLVQRALSVCHANLEMGLAHAREQEPFILRVSALLDGLGLEYTVRMMRSFDVVFNIEYPDDDLNGTEERVRHALTAEFDAEADGDGLVVSHRREAGIQCRVIFGDIPQ